jgi:hypothetical protein
MENVLISDSEGIQNDSHKGANYAKETNRFKASCDKVGLNKTDLLIKKGVVILLFIMFQLCGCGGSGSDDPVNDTNTPGNQYADISGQWGGTTTMPNGSDFQTTLNLTQTGENISGTWDAVSENETYHSEDVSGTVNDSTVTISVAVRDAGNPDNYLEYVYSGTLDGSNINGDATRKGDWNGDKIDDMLNFFLSRPGDGTDNTDNIIEITDHIEQPTTWSNQNIYVISENLDVRNTLTIQAGTIIKFQSESAIYVYEEGVISARGTPDDPIVFTSYADDDHGGDTNGDGNVSTPAMGDWNGIILSETQRSVFDHCHFLYSSVSEDNSALKLDDSQAAISNCVFAHNGGGYYFVHYYGALDATNARLGTTINSNRFYDNIIPLSINQNFDLDDTNIFQNASGTVFNTNNAVFFHTVSTVDNSRNGEIDRNLRWEETEVAIVIDLSWCRLLSNATLTLGDNVVLKFVADSQFNLVDGGTALSNHDGEGVFFTSFRDDTLKGDSNGDGDATSPTENDWAGIATGQFSNPPFITDWPNIRYADNIDIISR